MTEFLTENRRRAYPLEHALASDDSGLRTRLLLDACVSCSSELTDTRIRLLSLTCAKPSGGTALLTLGIGTSASDKVDVTLPTGLGDPQTVFASGGSYRVLLTVCGPAVDALVASLADGTTETVGIPFALRCTMSAPKRVTSVAGYSPTNCKTPVFTNSESPVEDGTVSSGRLVLQADEGTDLEALSLEPIEGRVLRVSALAAPADTQAVVSDVDIMVRGDDCISVEAIPGAFVDDEGVIRAFNEEGSDYENETDCGVIVVGTKCTPCCQCSDYADAVDALRPFATRATTVEGVLNAARTLYENAVNAYNAAKAASVAAIGSYDNITASASAVTSGALYTSANAAGTRSRIALTLLVTNMTLESATISGVQFTVPGYNDNNTPAYRIQWATAGSDPKTGSNLSTPWTLAPGDSLTVTATYVKTATSNAGARPTTGLSASFTASLPTNAAIPTRPLTQSRTVTVT